MGLILKQTPLGFPWTTADPFLFCVHHDDAYPAGNADMGPATSLAGLNLGNDFEGKDGWRMYHGKVVPGFPQHPHRGFETVTVVRRGLIDHSDSLGATARFGNGDAQWLTAGSGIVHSEMFPLLDDKQPNPLELFQIWLNLPAAKKMVPAYFSMIWRESIPRQVTRDEEGRVTEVSAVAGRLGELVPPAPPPDSWAAQHDADLRIWTIKLAPHAKYVLSASTLAATRTLYFFRGASLKVGDEEVAQHASVTVQSGVEIPLENGAEESEILLLQGRPISEPVAQYGPFVMNTPAEIERAMSDYRRTQFGGWPWPSDGPVHARETGRFAQHAGGRIDKP